MYALPALTTWKTAGGWSNTSGGASNGTWPTTGDTAIFDANSGASRSIAATAEAVSSINTTGAAAMTFTGSGIIVTGATANFAGTASISTLTVGSASAQTFTPPATINTLQMNGFCTLGGNLVVTGAWNWFDPGAPYNFSGGGYNVTAPKLDTSGASTSGNSFTAGSGTYTLTGTGAILVPTSFTFTFSGTTIKVTDTSATLKDLTQIGTLLFAANLWLACPGSGGVQLPNGAQINTLTMDPGCKLILPNSATVAANSFSLVGTAPLPLTFVSATSGFIGYFQKIGGGTITIEYATLKDTGAQAGTTIVAKASTNLGNSGSSVNVTYYKAPPNFMSFI
jgi:hypothetical protein